MFMLWFRQKKDGNVMIYDLGGGTLDVSILEITSGVFEVKATSGLRSLGGEDFDKVIADWVLDQFETAAPKADIMKVRTAHQAKKDAEKTTAASLRGGLKKSC